MIIIMDNFIIKYLFVLTLLNSSLACINLRDNLGDLYPPIAYVEVGKNLEFICHLSENFVDDNKIDASDIYFTFKPGEPSKAQRVDQRNVHILDPYNVELRIQNVSLSEDGAYSCYTSKFIVENETKNDELICTSDAYIGFKPLNVSNFKCIYYQSKKMECSWSISPNNPKLDNNYTLIWLYHGIDKDYRPYRNECEHIKISGQTAKCTFATVDFQYMYYNFKLISRNELGNTTQHFKFNTTSILKLNPPENVTFNENILSWKIPNRDYHVLCQINVSMNGRVVENVLIENKFRYTFDNLKPYTEYNFSISCKINDQSNHYWSLVNWNSTKTNPAIPSRPPHVINQSFESKLNLINNTRFIVLYWQDLPEDDKNGDNFAYFITYSILNEDYWQNVTTKIAKAEFPYLSINSSYEFRIYSQNEIGFSTSYSKVILPSNGQILQSSSNLNIVVDNLKYWITWKKFETKSDEYAIFWCIPNNNGHCERQLNWILTRQLELNITLDHDNYMFGISISDDTSFSPISWQSCSANLQQKKIGFSNRDFVIKETTPNSILTAWKLQCEAQRILVNEFVIQLQKCKSGEPSSRDCDPAVKFSTQPSTEEYLINDLEPNTYYHIRVKANGLIGGEVPKVTRTKPPRNPLKVKIIETNNVTMKLQWKVPNYVENQLISVFRVEFFQKEAVVLLDACQKEHCFYNITLPHNLTPYTDYPIFVLACRQNCSNPNEVYYRSEVLFKTKPSYPGMMQLPVIESINSSKLRIHVKPPSKPNGPINYYYVLIRENDGTIEEYRYVNWKNMEYIDQSIGDCNYNIFSKDRIFNVAVKSSNALSNEEFQGNYTTFQTITLHCKTNVTSAIFIILVGLIFILISICVMIYCGYSYFQNLKKKDNLVQIPLQLEKFLNRGPDARDDQNLDNNSKNISNSVTNTSMTSESSGENSNSNSNSTERNMISQSENLYSMDSGVNDLNYRDNHEYYLDCDDSTKPFLEQQEKQACIEPKTRNSKALEYSPPSPPGLNQQYKALVSQPSSPAVNKPSSTYVSPAETNHYLPHSPLLSNNITSQV